MGTTSPHEARSRPERRPERRPEPEPGPEPRPEPGPGPAPGNPSAPRRRGEHLVPPDARLTGRWRRTLLETADGERDTTTDVTWVQAGELYVDLRLPAQGPDPSRATRLRDLDRDQATALARAQGFAGRLLADGPFAHWQRLVDLQPAAATPDQGRLVHDGDRLVETGRDASYVEHWHRATGHRAPHAGLLLRQLATGALAVLVRVGDDVGWARGRTPALGRAGDLADQVRAAADDEAAQDLLDAEVALGRVEACGVRLTHANLPWRAGADLRLAAHGEGVSTEDLAPDGSPVRHVWQVLSREGDATAIPFGQQARDQPA